MSFSPSLFFSHMRGKSGPAQPSRFQVIIPIPTYISNFIGNSIIDKIINFPNSIYSDVSDIVNTSLSSITDGFLGGNITSSGNPTLTRYLSLQCENAELPGKSLFTADAKIYGPTFKIPYLVSYEPVSLTFICTNEFEERKLFDRWMEAIMPTDTNNLRFPKGTGNGSSGYMTQLKIIQYDESIRQIYAVELIDAFPVGIASQRLDWGATDFHRLSVQFAYHKYKTIYKSKIDFGEVASSALGTIAAKYIPKSF